MPTRTAKPLTAYVLDEGSGDMPIAAAPTHRPWMDATPARYAYRCLPLVMANQMGWWIACPRSFTARWDGGNDCRGLRIRFGQGKADSRIISHFGSGVLTFLLPYLFRSPRGVNLWVKGPSNTIKDGIQPLEGVVETDWSPSTFTMNWKFTRPDHPVRFVKGEPICMIVPLPRGLAESLEPVLRPIASEPGLERQYRAWNDGRTVFLDGLDRGEPETVRAGWQKDYMQGRSPNGRRFPAHQTRVRLRDFADE
jgi:hypothetical protein